MPIDADKTIIRPVWSILAKGLSGNGKTIFSCGKAFRPVYVFMLEGRMESALTYYRKLDGNAKGILYDNFTFSEGGFKEMDKQMDAIIKRPEYKTVVISSLTSFGRSTLQALMDQSGSSKTKAGIQVPILEDYNYEDAAMIHQMVGFLISLKNQGVNVILEAHVTPYEIRSRNKDSGAIDMVTTYQILTKGKKAPAEVPSWFNEVWLFEKNIGMNAKGDTVYDYRINTIGTATDSCKTSFGIQPISWTDKDASLEIFGQLPPDISSQSPKDPNAPTIWRG